MNIFIYRGGMSLVKKSGIGMALRQQCEMLSHMPQVRQTTFGPSDVVQINTVFPDSVIVALAARLFHKKVIYYGHSTKEDFKHSFRGSTLLAPLFQRWITFCYRLGDQVITPTQYSKRLIESYGVDRPVTALSNGIDNAFWARDDHDREKFREKYHLTGEQKVVMSVGHYIERKGILDFLELARRMPDKTFFWFGYTNLNMVPAEVARQVRNAPDNVVFPGYVSREELRQAYHGADLFCFLSHEETEGIVVLEALASGIPTIVRDMGVYEGWLQDGKNCRKFRDEQELDTLCQIMTRYRDDAQRQQGLATAKSRDYGMICDCMEEIYRSLVAQRTVAKPQRKLKMID